MKLAEFDHMQKIRAKLNRNEPINKSDIRTLIEMFVESDERRMNTVKKIEELANELR